MQHGGRAQDALCAVACDDTPLKKILVTEDTENTQKTRTLLCCAFLCALRGYLFRLDRFQAH